MHLELLANIRDVRADVVGDWRVVVLALLEREQLVPAVHDEVAGQRGGRGRRVHGGGVWRRVVRARAAVAGGGGALVLQFGDELGDAERKRAHEVVARGAVPVPQFDHQAPAVVLGANLTARANGERFMYTPQAQA